MVHQIVFSQLSIGEKGFEFLATTGKHKTAERGQTIN